MEEEKSPPPKPIHGATTLLARKDFPDPENCWQPGSQSQPIWSKILFSTEAELDIPQTCPGKITARILLRDVQPGGASLWADAVGFGISDGTTIGKLHRASSVSESNGVSKGVIAFEHKMEFVSCSFAGTQFIYVVYPPTGTHTFIEVGYFPRIVQKNGRLINVSPPPAIRLHPCNNVKPIRSPYTPTEASTRYRSLPRKDRHKLTQETNRRFGEETGITRRLNPENPNDAPLIFHWLRIRDEVMASAG